MLRHTLVMRNIDSFWIEAIIGSSPTPSFVNPVNEVTRKIEAKKQVSQSRMENLPKHLMFTLKLNFYAKGQLNRS